MDYVRNSGSVTVEVFGPDGIVTSALHAVNLVVDSGLAWIAARLTEAPAPMSHMAMGTWGGAVDPGHTTLGGEQARVALASAVSAGVTTTYIATFPPGAMVGQVAELGIFNALSGGTMLNRVAIPAQAKGPLDTVKVTWAVTQAT